MVSDLLYIFLILIIVLFIWNLFKIDSKQESNKETYDNNIQNDLYKAQHLKQNVLSFDKIPLPDLYDLARVYHYGVSDKYDSHGNFIPGIKPEPELAIPIYEYLLIHKFTKCLYDITQLYHYGVPGSNVVNLNNAIVYYKLLYNFTDDKLDVLDKLEEIYKETYNIQLKFYINQQKHLLSQQLQQNTQPQNTQPQQNQPHFPYQNNNPIQAIRAQIIDQVPIIETTLGIRNDLHNVHDSVLTKTVKNSIEKLKKDTVMDIDFPTTIQNIKNEIEKYPNENVKSQARLALDTIQRNNDTLHSVGMKETELLHLIYNRINSPINVENQQVLKENLINELSECIEFNKPVCTTGRFTRILDTINGVDPEVSIKPKWMIQKELIDKSGALYKAKVETLDSQQKAAIESIQMTPEQETVYNKIKSDIQTEIKDKFTEDYVTPGILTQEALTHEIDKFIDDIM